MCLHWQYQIYPPGMVGVFLQSAASSDYYNFSQKKKTTQLRCVRYHISTRSVGPRLSCSIAGLCLYLNLSLIYFCQCHIEAG